MTSKSYFGPGESCIQNSPENGELGADVMLVSNLFGGLYKSPEQVLVILKAFQLQPCGLLLLKFPVL